MPIDGQLLNNRYRLIARIASGGMAVVYKAQDTMLGRIVAVKILRESFAEDPSFQARFQREAQAAANLSHPNIVTVHDFGLDGDKQYIVMEYVEGSDLKQRRQTSECARHSRRTGQGH
jgi:serine/threonine protein kinase